MMNDSLLAFWAITPAFAAAGALLVSVPIIIHLLNRRRFKIVKWAAMEYLLQALKKNRRRIKFEQLILLATRCSLLLLLGLALARLLGCNDSSIASIAGQKAALHVFVIDNSYSMSYEADRPNARTHLDQAKLLAKQQIEQLAGGSESVAIVLAAKVRPQNAPTSQPSTPEEVAQQSGRMILLRPSYDLKAALDAVDRIEQSYSSTDMPGALAAAAQVARDEKKQPLKFLYVLTDFTKSAWDDPSASQLLKQEGQELSDVFSTRIRINDLGRPGQWNYAVTDVHPDSGLVTSTFPVTFLATIRGFGQGNDSVVQWKWDDKLVEGGGGQIKPQPDSEPLRNPNVSNLIKGEGGAHVLSVSLLDDEKLKTDNTRYRIVKVASAMKVLIVEGERGRSGTYLDLNLAPKQDRDSTGHLRSSTYVVPEVISDDELPNRILTDYRAVILTGAGAVTTNQADQLAKFVRQGGTLMIFMGEKVSADAYNSIFLPRHLLPGKLIARKTVTAEGKGYTFDFNPNGVLHPALKIFRGEEGTGLDTAQIFTYFQIELAPQDKPEIVLNYVPEKPNTPSDPAIIIHNLDKGRIVTFTTTANGEWNALPQKPAYIPLIHELLANSVDIGDHWMNLTVGQAVEIPPSLKLTANPVLSDVSGKPLPIDPIIENGQTLFRSRPLDKPGLYQLSIGSEKLPIAVNVPAEEADLRLIPPEAVKKILGGIDMQMYADSIPASALARDDGSDLGWTLMCLVLALAAVECFMAMRFGHYRKATVVTRAKAA